MFSLLNRRGRYPFPVLILILASLLAVGLACESQVDSAEISAEGLVQFVDTRVGTGSSTTPSAIKHSERKNEPRGQTFPAAGFPHGMTNWTPQTHSTEQKCNSPYYYKHERFQGFRASRWMSGSCTQDYGSMTIMPLRGNMTLDSLGRTSSFSHDSEVARPDYYKVDLLDSGIRAEVTGTSRAGILRFTYPEADTAVFVITPNSDERMGVAKVDLEAQEIVIENPAHRIYQGWGESAGFSGHYIIKFEREIVDYGVWTENEISEKGLTSSKDSLLVGAYVSFPVEAGESVLVRVGSSMTGSNGARKNLETEIPDWNFGGVQKAASSAWEKSLGKVRLEGASQDQAEVFYSSLYHASLLPRVFSDVDGSYPKFSGSGEVLKTAGHDYYADFSTWDTFRGVHPLKTILEPSKVENMIQSIILKSEQGGWLPIFPSWNNYTAAMIGDHLTSVITDAYVKGIRNYDVETAWDYMYKNATSTPVYAEYLDGKGRRALDAYLEYGFLGIEEPIEEAFHKEEQVSRTLEYAYDDFQLYQLAKALGKSEFVDEFRDRAMNYRNIIDQETGLARGRSRDGSWVSPFDPNEPLYPFITEGTPYQYTWYVPHDVDGLIQHQGGKDAFVRLLDRFFDNKEYWHGNEPGHHTTYLYPYAGQAWKTQKLVTEVMRDEYGTGPGGISGNDDAGQMSAWYVFSSLGFYPVSPGFPYYVIGSPVHPKAEINLDGGAKFEIIANEVSELNIYIQSASINGENFDRAWINHHEILQGGQLVFEMGPEPNTEWASKNYPPSLSTIAE